MRLLAVTLVFIGFFLCAIWETVEEILFGDDDAVDE